MMIDDSAAPSVAAEIGAASEQGGESADVPSEVLLRLTEDRDRLAHDLNDTLVRRMFAVSLDLHAALSRIEHATGDRYAAEKIRQAIAGLDQAIDDIRHSVARGGRLGDR
jgi:signal transduction histidine kinase